MNDINVNPTFCSQKTIAFTLGAVAAVAALITTAALAILFVPPLTALTGLAAWILYVAGGASATLAVASGLGCVVLCLQKEVVPVQKGPTVELKTFKIRGHVYYVLDSNFWQMLFDIPDSEKANLKRQLTEKMRATSIEKTVTYQGNFFTHNLPGEIPINDYKTETWEALTPLAKNFKNGRLFIAGWGWRSIVYLVHMECLLHKGPITLQFVKDTIQACEKALRLELAPGPRAFLETDEFINSCPK